MSFNYDWSSVTKAELEGMDDSGNPKKPVAPGSYDAIITDVEVGLSKGGAFGITLTYTIEGGPENNRDVYERIYLTKKDGDPIAFGPQRLKRRLMTLGFSSSKINDFKFPKDGKSLGDFKQLLDLETKIETVLEVVKSGNLAGASMSRVTKVIKRG